MWQHFPEHQYNKINNENESNTRSKKFDRFDKILQTVRLNCALPICGRWSFFNETASRFDTKPR